LDGPLHTYHNRLERIERTCPPTLEAEHEINGHIVIGMSRGELE
jgi:hypothetical protein